MIRSDLGEPCFVTVISADRPESVAEMSKLVGPATWIVRPEDVEAYSVVDSAGLAPPVAAADGLVGARNHALELAFKKGVPCVQLSDDLTKLELLTEAGARPASFADVVAELAGAIFLTPYRLAGAAPTANPFYASLKMKRRHFIVGDLLYVLPSPERFDPAFRLKEDYDFTCGHIAAHGGVCRLDWVLASFRHRSNPGGAVAVRTPELEQEMIGLLKERWPGWFKDNARRPNEVLLRPPAAGVSSLP